MVLCSGNSVAISNARFVAALGMIALGSLPAMVGCQLVRPHEPVSKSVAQSRRLSDRGQNAMEHGDLVSASTLLSQAVKACPTDVEAHRQYAEVLWQGGQRDLAIEQLEKAMKLAPDDPQLAVRMGEMDLAVGKLDDARRMAEQAFDSTPNDARAWALHGRVAEASGQYEQALADFDRSLEYCHDDRQLLLETAELYRRLNRPQRALATLTNLCETYGPNEEPQDVLYLKGLALGALGRNVDAAETFSLAMSHGDPTPELYYRLGEAQLATGRQLEADQSLAQALSMDPNHAPSRALRERIEVASRPVNTIYP